MLKIRLSHARVGIIATVWLAILAALAAAQEVTSTDLVIQNTTATPVSIRAVGNKDDRNALIGRTPGEDETLANGRVFLRPGEVHVFQFPARFDNGALIITPQDGSGAAKVTRLAFRPMRKGRRWQVKAFDLGRLVSGLGRHWLLDNKPANKRETILRKATSLEKFFATAERLVIPTKCVGISKLANKHNLKEVDLGEFRTQAEYGGSALSKQFFDTVTPNVAGLKILHTNGKKAKSLLEAIVKRTPQVCSRADFDRRDLDTVRAGLQGQLSLQDQASSLLAEAESEVALVEKKTQADVDRLFQNYVPDKQLMEDVKAQFNRLKPTIDSLRSTQLPDWQPLDSLRREMDTIRWMRGSLEDSIRRLSKGLDLSKLRTKSGRSVAGLLDNDRQNILDEKKRSLHRCLGDFLDVQSNIFTAEEMAEALDGMIRDGGRSLRRKGAIVYLRKIQDSLKSDATSYPDPSLTKEARDAIRTSRQCLKKIERMPLADPQPSANGEIGSPDAEGDMKPSPQPKQVSPPKIAVTPKAGSGICPPGQRPATGLDKGFIGQDTFNEGKANCVPITAAVPKPAKPPAPPKKKAEVKHCTDERAEFEEARELYKNGRGSGLKRAKAILSELAGSAALQKCEDLRKRVASGLDKIERLRAALKSAKATLLQCDPQRLAAHAAQLAQVNHPWLQELSKRMANSVPIAAGLRDANRHLATGGADSLKIAGETINRVDLLANRIPPAANGKTYSCINIGSRIERLRQKFSGLPAKLNAERQANCVSRKGVHAFVPGPLSDNGKCVCKPGYQLDAKLGRCEELAAPKPSKPSNNLASSCGAVNAIPGDPGKCKCRPGWRWKKKGKNHICIQLTRKQKRKEARADCRRMAKGKRKNYAFTQFKRDGSYTCHWCDRGWYYKNGVCSQRSIRKKRLRRKKPPRRKRWKPRRIPGKLKNERV